MTQAVHLTLPTRDRTRNHRVSVGSEEMGINKKQKRQLSRFITSLAFKLFSGRYWHLFVVSIQLSTSVETWFDIFLIALCTSPFTHTVVADMLQYVMMSYVSKLRVYGNEIKLRNL